MSIRTAALMAILAVGAAGCASDPIAERLEHPRLGAAGWGVASEVPPSPRSPAYDAAVRGAAEALDATVARECAQPRTSLITRTETLAASDAAFAALAGTDDRVVRERVEVSACGETRVHAVYPVAADDVVQAETGVPGASIASLGLQRDVVDQVIAQAAGIMAAEHPEGVCDATEWEPWVLDTALASGPKDGRWSERWTIAACGARRTITVNFEETVDGALFSAPIALAEE